MGKKYYAVYNGLDKSPSIYDSWDITEMKVRGIKSVKHKSFKTIDEAKSFLLSLGAKEEEIKIDFSSSNTIVNLEDTNEDTNENTNENKTVKSKYITINIKKSKENKEKKEGKEERNKTNKDTKNKGNVEIRECKNHQLKFFINDEDKKEFIDFIDERINNSRKENSLSFSKLDLDKEINNDKVSFQSEKKAKENNEVTCFVDGSFDNTNSIYSYGIVVIENGEVIDRLNGKENNEKYVSMRNVAGEVLGSTKAIEYAILNGYKKINIYFDYQGIESWATGSWKRNNDLTKGYHEFIKEMKSKIEIKFFKVTAHSGNTYNDEADSLAKSILNK